MDLVISGVLMAASAYGQGKGRKKLENVMKEELVSRGNTRGRGAGSWKGRAHWETAKKKVRQMR